MKSFVDDLGKRFVITGEFEPPSGVSDSFLEKARKFKPYVDAINSTDSPLGKPHLSALVASYLVKKELGMEPVLQMCARDRNKVAIINDLLGASLLGVNHVLCLAGDYPKDAKPVYDLDSTRFARLVKEEMPKKYPGFEMKAGVAYNPMCKPNEPEQIVLEKKMKWADFVQTQMVFDFDLLDNKAVQNFKEKILVGVLPLLSKGMAEYFNNNVPGVSIPPETIKSINAPEDGIKLANEITKAAKKEGFGGAHLMVFDVEDRIPEILAGLV
ncbi:MAG: methylenetetrahydrofolate reductase [Candidatus Altiarchaeota archaeon]|nr:methylenetetrahydrofolate reductase [Candidatus Altiarchaeota archaeon]